MKSPLNDFILDLLNFRKDPKVLEKKLELLRDEYFAEKQKLEEQKLAYLQKFEQPRQDYQTALTTYLENLSTLLSRYKSTPSHRGALHDWLKESTNFPEVLKNKPPSTFSYLP